MPEINWGGLIIPYTTKKSSKAKHLRITVGQDGVVVTVPAALSQRRAISFLEQKKEWIAQKLNELNRANPQPNGPRDYLDGAELPFQGEKFRLKLVESDRQKTTARLTGDCFLVHINRQMPEAARASEIQRKLGQLYKELAREAICERVNFFKTQLNVDYNQIRLKEQKTRWGSCSKKGNLNFNWKLVMAPPDIIDYVVVHELCHLIHMNHSPAFWQCVADVIPDYRICRLWLKKHGGELYL